ncbi:MAG: hypothetical protein IJV00_06035 [Clostridia bacterium]|nr:hypothetical protein [Clostridia bacterium]
MNDMKTVNARFELADSLSFLDEETVMALLLDEERLDARRRMILRRRIGAVAACLALSGGAGLALYSREQTEAAQPALTQPETLSPGVTAQDGTKSGPKTVCAKPGEPGKNDQDSFSTWESYMPCHEAPGDVSVMPALKKALEENPDPETLFYVAIGADCRGLDSYNGWREEDAWKEYEAAWAGYWSGAEKEYEAIKKLWYDHSRETGYDHCAYGFASNVHAVTEFSGQTCPVAFARNCPECQRILNEINDVTRRDETLKEHWEKDHNDCETDLEIYSRLKELGRKNDGFNLSCDFYEAEKAAEDSFNAKIREAAGEYLKKYGIETQDFRELEAAVRIEDNDGTSGVSIFSSPNAAFAVLTRDQIENLAAKTESADGLYFGFSIELMPEEKDLVTLSPAFGDRKILTDVSPDDELAWDELERSLLTY